MTEANETLCAVCGDVLDAEWDTGIGTERPHPTDHIFIPVPREPSLDGEAARARLIAHMQWRGAVGASAQLAVDAFEQAVRAEERATAEAGYQALLRHWEFGQIPRDDYGRKYGVTITDTRSFLREGDRVNAAVRAALLPASPVPAPAPTDDYTHDDQRQFGWTPAELAQMLAAGEPCLVCGERASIVIAADDRDFDTVCWDHLLHGMEGMLGAFHGALMVLCEEDSPRYLPAAPVPAPRARRRKEGMNGRRDLHAIPPHADRRDGGLARGL